MSALTRIAHSRTLARQLSPVVEALVQTVVANDKAQSTLSADPFVGPTRDELLTKLRGMPSYLGTPMLGATLAFDAYGLMRGGRAFRHQDLDQQKAQLAAWKQGPVSFMRDFVDFYEKMGIFLYYSQQEEWVEVD